MAPYCIQMLLTLDYGGRVKEKPERPPKPKLHTTALAGSRASRFINSTQRVQYSPFVNKKTPALRGPSLNSNPRGDGEHVAQPVPRDLE